MFILFFFFNDTATTEIYTLSLHDALPISAARNSPVADHWNEESPFERANRPARWPSAHLTGASRKLAQIMLCSTRTRDRKSTRLNSSHANISYAVFCLKKKKTKHTNYH